MRKTLILDLLALLFFGLGALFVFALQGSPSLPVLSNIVITFLSFFAALSAFLAYDSTLKKSEFKQSGFILFFAFLALFMGDLLWSVLENFFGIQLPVGSFADFAWIVGYFLIIIALVVLVSKLFITLKTKVVSVIFTFIFAFWFIVYHVPDMVNLASVINHAYIAMDILIIGLISMILVPLATTRNRFVAFWVLFASAFLVRIVFDVLFAELVDLDLYWSGHFIDAVYMLSYVVFVFAADFRAKLAGDVE